MKHLYTLLAITALCGSSLFATAQQPDAAPSATDSQKQASGEWRKHREFIESLPEDVRNRFKEAREEAMKDPKIQALREKAEAAAKGGARGGGNANLNAAANTAVKQANAALAAAQSAENAARKNANAAEKLAAAAGTAEGGRRATRRRGASRGTRRRR